MPFSYEGIDPSFTADEISVSDNEPVELYEFIGNLQTYRYTSHTNDYIYQGNTFTAVAMMRGSIAEGSQQRPPELEVQMPHSLDVVRAYGRGFPPRSLRLKVIRIQRRSEQAITYWHGTVTGFTIQAEVASCRSSSLMGDIMKTPIPNVYYQSLCNHKLYDARCQMVNTDFDVSTTVVGVSGRTITVTGDGGNPDGWFTAGEIVRDADGERRLIVDHTGNVLIINQAFVELDADDAVTLFAGCDHTVQTCLDKFDNVINFGGHPFVPNVNPYRLGINVVKK